MSQRTHTNPLNDGAILQIFVIAGPLKNMKMTTTQYAANRIIQWSTIYTITFFSSDARNRSLHLANRLLPI